MRKLDYIDALRGLAILGVIMIHTNYYGKSDLPNTIQRIVEEGGRGVQLFYLASAFTLFLSFRNRISKEISPIRNFFLRRFFRIAPMYYIGIAYYLFQDGFGPRRWLGDQSHITGMNILSNCTFFHGFNPYWINSIVPGGWSIGVEMTFYAVLPFLFSKIKSLNHAFHFFIFSLILNSVLQLFFIKFQLIGDQRLWNDFLFFYFPSQLPIFSLGILLYFIVVEKESMRNISGRSILICSGLILAQLGTGTQIIFQNHILFGIAFLFLALALSTCKFKIIVNPVMNYIGKISFSMYLVHFAVLHWLTKFDFINYANNGIFNYAIRFFLVSVLTIVFSTLLYKIIEVPFQDMGKWLINRLEKSDSQTYRRSSIRRWPGAVTPAKLYEGATDIR
jgi:peptidoglycan/LPS O-acetylase OafA/YrhL